jgi:hypothetical protein
VSPTAGRLGAGLREAVMVDSMPHLIETKQALSKPEGWHAT